MIKKSTEFHITLNVFQAEGENFNEKTNKIAKMSFFNINVDISMRL